MKSFGVLKEYSVDGHLLLVVRSLYSYSEVYVSVGTVKSQPFTVGVGLQHGSVLSPLLFTVYMNWTDSRSRVNKGVTAGSCRINHLLFADNLIALASYQQGLQYALDQHSTACNQAGMKISTKKMRYYVSPENQVSVR